jgi:autophagy-related protein 11
MVVVCGTTTSVISLGHKTRSVNSRPLNTLPTHIFSSKSIFVFNKYYLDYDIDEVLRDLRAEPLLQPPIEGT